MQKISFVKFINAVPRPDSSETKEVYRTSVAGSPPLLQLEYDEKLLLIVITSLRPGGKVNEEKPPVKVPTSNVRYFQ